MMTHQGGMWSSGEGNLCPRKGRGRPSMPGRLGSVELRGSGPNGGRSGTRGGRRRGRRRRKRMRPSMAAYAPCTPKRRLKHEEGGPGTQDPLPLYGNVLFCVCVCVCGLCVLFPSRLAQNGEKWCGTSCQGLSIPHTFDALCEWGCNVIRYHIEQGIFNVGFAPFSNWLTYPTSAKLLTPTL